MTTNTFDDALLNLDRAAEVVSVHQEVIDQLREHQEVLTISIPVRMDDGSLKLFTGIRARHNDALGPTKGGIRFHPEVCLDEVKSLSFWMTMKCALNHLPYGGGKGGIIVDAKSLSKMELERLARGFMKRCAHIIGPERDIPAPDMYTNATIMGWMMDEYSRMKGVFSPGVITGKPLTLGGSLGRDEATGRGAYLCIKQLEKKKGWNNGDITVAFQGFGNGAQAAARLLHQDGYRIVAISDSKGGIYSNEGFDVPSIMYHKAQHQKVAAVYCQESVCEEVDAQHISNDELLALDVDILLPSALENAIHEDNVGAVQAKYIVEIANGPVTPDADQALEKQGVQVIPDILANSGGVIVSYFEWVQNRSGDQWPLEKVNDRLKTIIDQSFDRVWDLAQDKGCALRSAAYAVALLRMDEVISAKGTADYFQS